MSEMQTTIKSILGIMDRHNGHNLIEEIEQVSKKGDLFYQWQNNEKFLIFIEHLKPHILEVGNENDWNGNENFLALSNAIHDEIISQLKSRENEMTTPADISIGTKLAVASGVLLIIGIALGAYYYKNRKKTKTDENKENQSLFDKGKNFVEEITKSSKNDSNTFKLEPPIQSIKNPTLSFSQHDLLLIIPANQLDDKLTKGSLISKSETEKLIANTMRAYCFSENNIEGHKVLNAIDCSEEPINYQTESRVFLQLSLSAKPEITQKRDKLGIREAIKPNQQVQIKTLKKMGTLRSISDFYSI